MIPQVLTYADAFELLVGFAEGKADSEHKLASRDAIRRAIRGAYDDIAMAHKWSFLHRQDRVFLNARQTTGTVVYDHSGGATCERQLTLTDSTWPSWATDATVRFGTNDYRCEVEAVKSSTVLQLDATLNPGQDVASSTYVLYERWKVLPADFVSFTGPMTESDWRLGRPVSLSEIEADDKYNNNTGYVDKYAVAEAPGIYDRKAVFFTPQQSSAQTIDFVYRRRPRVLRYSGHDAVCDAGTISNTGTAVTGSSTSFASGMVGSIIRISSSSTVPAGLFGENPYAEERSISAVGGTKALTLDEDPGTNYSGVKYLITDPIDLGRHAHNAFLRRCEYLLAIGMGYKGIPTLRNEANDALVDAMAADNSEDFDPIFEPLWPRSVVGTVTTN